MSFTNCVCTCFDKSKLETYCQTTKRKQLTKNHERNPEIRDSARFLFLQTVYKPAREEPLSYKVFPPPASTAPLKLLCGREQTDFGCSGQFCKILMSNCMNVKSGIESILCIYSPAKNTEEHLYIYISHEQNSQSFLQYTCHNVRRICLKQDK